MGKVPLRVANALIWPISIWTSLTRLDQHPADDYVERTSPIVAAALSFWICLVAFLGLSMDIRWAEVTHVMLYFLPVIYVVGFWLYAMRDAHYRG